MLIQNATFKWGVEAKTNALSSIDLRVAQGELVAVVGTVGSGKVRNRIRRNRKNIILLFTIQSSLLCALLGEIYKDSGHVRVSGSIAYVPQQAWMQNASLRYLFALLIFIVLFYIYYILFCCFTPF